MSGAEGAATGLASGHGAVTVLAGAAAVQGQGRGGELQAIRRTTNHAPRCMKRPLSLASRPGSMPDRPAAVLGCAACVGLGLGDGAALAGICPRSVRSVCRPTPRRSRSARTRCSRPRTPHPPRGVAQLQGDPGQIQMSPSASLAPIVDRPDSPAAAATARHQRRRFDVANQGVFAELGPRNAGVLNSEKRVEQRGRAHGRSGSEGWCWNPPRYPLGRARSSTIGRASPYAANACESAAAASELPDRASIKPLGEPK